MKNRVLLLSTAAIALALPTFAMAQAENTASVAAPDDTVVIVTGIRKSLMASQDIKKKSDFVVDAITAEDIGKFPNANVADALQQIPGIAISSSNGEGQKITVRGLGPEFNTVLWNGRRIATDATDRSFNFDTISSDLLGGTEVYKTTNVALQTGGIGSTINLSTIRPLDLRKPVAAFSARALYDKNTEKFTPEAFALYSRTFLDGHLGVLLAASYQRRDDVNQYTTAASSTSCDSRSGCCDPMWNRPEVLPAVAGCRRGKRSDRTEQ
jgi:iron complex outermembrane receptor protein